MWPRSIRTERLSGWPGRFTPILQRRKSPFQAPLTDSLRLLERETQALKASRVVLRYPFASIQLDATGHPLFGSRPEHPGVVVTFNTRHGHLAFPCDTYAGWEANVRAIALALDALRAIDRYGVTSHGEQYAGFITREDPTP